jgi:hypothetical protein
MASRADQADQTRGGQLLPDLGQLTATSDKARRLGGQVARSVSELGHCTTVSDLTCWLRSL